jgi:FAD/FMN-containing dehydrogenase
MAPHDVDLLSDRIDQLRSRLRGTVCQPGEAAYLAASPWNTSVLFQPAAVIAAADADDVSTAFRFAAEHGYKVAVQSTGHGAVSRGEDTVLIHTGSMDRCVVSPVDSVATIGAGVTAQRLIDAAAEHGLAAIVGSAGTVGVAGYLSGGGIGPFVSTFGLSADYIDSLDAVTADGEIHHVSPNENPDLFWAFRGGKSRLGIITSVTLRLEPLTHFYGGAIWFDGQDAPAVVHEWATWSASLPDEISTSVALTRMPAEGPPDALAGRYVVSVRVGSVLPAERTEELLTPIRNAATPILDSLEWLEYRHAGRISDEPTEPEPLVQDESLLSEFPAAAVDALLTAFDATSEAQLAVTEVRRLGGALAREPEQASPFSYRADAYSVLAIGFAPYGETAPVRAAAAGVLDAVASWSGGRTLANFVATSDPDRASQAFDQATNERLNRLADEYDPARILTP